MRDVDTIVIHCSASTRATVRGQSPRTVVIARHRVHILSDGCGDLCR